MAYASDASGIYEVFAEPFPPDGSRTGFALRNRLNLPSQGNADQRRVDSLTDGRIILTIPAGPAAGADVQPSEIVIVDGWIQEVLARVPPL